MQLNSPYVKAKTMKAPFMAIGNKPVIKAYLGDEEVYNRENAYDYDFYDYNNILINNKINEEIEKIFNKKKKIEITIKQYSVQIPSAWT